MAGLQAARRGALWGMVVADALAMPAHWYYNPENIKTGYDGWLTGYRAPNEQHPISFLAVSHATDGIGQESEGAIEKPVIGNVILQDKLQYWANDGQGARMQPGTHVHYGMKAGDNTLNVMTALHLMDTMLKVDADHQMSPRDLRAKVMEAYVSFMTSPDTHNDVYAESFHRLFFKDWASLETPPHDGESILKFAEDRYVRLEKEEEGGALPTVGSLVMALPWVLHYADRPVEECSQNVVEAVKLTHPSPSLLPYLTVYSHLLHAVLHGADLRGEVQKAAKSTTFKSDNDQLDTYLQQSSEASEETELPSDDLIWCQAAVKSLGMACAIDGALKTILLLAFRFDDHFEKGVLMNANCGGENVHRGAPLGALLGAFTTVNDDSIPDELISGLHSASQLSHQIADKL